MAFKDIHKLKKIVEVQKESIETEYLVVGKDAFAISLYRELVQKFGEEKVRLLSEDKIVSSDLLFKGPSTLRGDANKAVFKHLYPNVETQEINTPSIFYKDLTWKAFGGRSKSEALKHDEEFYVPSYLKIKEQDIYSWISEEETFYEELNQKAYQVKVKTVHYNDGKFTVECINGTEFHTNMLFFGKSPSFFLKSFSELSKLSNEFIQFCESTQTISGLYIKYLFNKPLSDLKETMFIPLSYTHEWGHFVGEFKETSKGQLADFFHYIDADHASEEDISRTIRALKKSFEKIFENFSKINFTEFISLEDELACLKIDDELFHKSLTNDTELLNKLFFIGKNAPIDLSWCANNSFEYSTKEISHLSRALLTEREVLKKI